MVLAGCARPGQAWVIAAFAAAYTAFAVFLVIRPETITNDWRRWQKRLGAIAMTAIGLVFVFLSVYNATTGRCLGTDTAVTPCPATWADPSFGPPPGPA